MAGREPMPANWRDKPANHKRWERLQNSYAFLNAALAQHGCLICHYCGKSPLKIVAWDDTFNQNDPYKATVDHVIPVSRGGPDTFDNMVVSCFACNWAKGTS